MAAASPLTVGLPIQTPKGFAQLESGLVVPELAAAPAVPKFNRAQRRVMDREIRSMAKRIKKQQAARARKAERIVEKANATVDVLIAAKKRFEETAR